MRPKSIEYTKHSLDKLRTKESRKFKIQKRKIEETIRNTKSLHELPSGVTRAVANLDRTYSLCVIYRVDNGKIRVITFFPAERGRYESKIL